ncbi:MAG TPA: FadR family transcriptional regulator [Candidatus Excrementavichristensenella intestinipullorum]|nr:FadR family transcriptional regulator [Candidatus Excrementavichristensenella intestinipullorum]
MKDMLDMGGVRISAVDLVIAQVKDMLIGGQLKAGDMLPTENSLAQMCRVSRGSVREAMKILNAYGIIDIRRGEGTFVCEKPSKFMFNPLLFQILVKDYDMASLVEIRQIIETGVMQLVIHYATDQEIQELERVNQEFTRETEAYPNSSLERMRELDIRFHRMTGEYSHNSLLCEIYSFIIDLFEPSIDPTRPGVADNHRGMVAALKRRDEQGALEYLKKHTRTWSVHQNHEEREITGLWAGKEKAL